MKQINKYIDKLKTYKWSLVKLLILISVIINVVLVIKIVVNDEDLASKPNIDVKVMLVNEQLELDHNQVLYDRDKNIVSATKSVNGKDYYNLKEGEYEVVRFDLDNGEAEILMLYVKK